MKKLTAKQKLEIAIKTLKMYGNMDFWKYRDACNVIERDGIVVAKDPLYTSLEVLDQNGNIRDGWKWAEDALRAMEGKKEESNVQIENPTE